MEHDLMIASSYLLLGAGIKYVDQAYDLCVFSKTKAKIVAAFCGILMGYLIISDLPSAMIFLAMVIALAITRKIDNTAFYIGIAFVLMLPIVFDGITKIQWIPFGILVISGIMDELGNDWADKRKNKRLVRALRRKDQKAVYDLAEKFFSHRFAMKLAVAGIVLFGFFDPVYFLAFLLFDLMYLLVDVYSTSIKVYSINRARQYSTA